MLVVEKIIKTASVCDVVSTVAKAMVIELVIYAAANVIEFIV